MLIFGFIVVLMGACESQEKSSLGFHLPDGDTERGRAAFLELKCNACHRVTKLDLPAPVADPPAPVVLGGYVAHEVTDGPLVTSILDPSYKVSRRYKREWVTSGNGSRMVNYREVMTTQELVDVVAFLHKQYQVVPEMLYP
jgi:hypothetical protein